MKSGVHLLVLCAALLASSHAQAAQPRKIADYVFTNGRVYTVNPDQPWAEAVAVRNNRIVHVGSTGVVINCIGPRTKVIDLKGRMLLPGFIDGHNHFLSGAYAKREVRLVGSRNKEEMLQGIMAEIFPMLPKAGITAFHDMGIWAPDLPQGYPGFELLRECEAAGKLPCRVVGVHGTRNATAPPEQHLATLKMWNRRYRSELVRVTGIKIWADGAFSTHNSVQLEPYVDRPETKGESGWTAEALARWIEAAHTAGFDAHIHTTGDGSLRRCLDAIETVLKKHGPKGRRHALHHINVIHPNDLPRFKALGVGGNATLERLVTDWDGTLKAFGNEKTNREYGIWKRLIDGGVNVSFGSGIPGADPEELAPLYQMQVALTRRLPGAATGVILPADRVPTLEQMLYGYTHAGAYQMRMEDLIGSIETGKRADLIILEKNLFDVPPDQLAAVKVLFTMMNGKVTHRDGI